VRCTRRTRIAASTGSSSRIRRTPDASREARASWLNAGVLGAAETGSSDAHHAELVGTAWTEFAG
jgi:hypothetical protein